MRWLLTRVVKQIMRFGDHCIDAFFQQTNFAD